jgi:hypothetical protein
MQMHLMRKSLACSEIPNKKMALEKMQESDHTEHCSGLMRRISTYCVHGLSFVVQQSR